MTGRNLRTRITTSLDGFCAARDVHRGTAWERLGVAYPDPREALRALEVFSATRLAIAGGPA